MKTYINLFAILLGILIVFSSSSCKKNDENNDNNIPDPGTEQCYILKLASHPISFLIEFKFQYNDQFQVIRIDGTETGHHDYLTVEYDINGNIIRIENYNDDDIMTAHQTFEYTNGLLTKGYEYSNNDYEYIYNYNNEGLLASIEISFASSSKGNGNIEKMLNDNLIGAFFSQNTIQNSSKDPNFVGSITFQWSNNKNVTKEIWTSGGGTVLQGNDHASYDNKKNSMKMLNFPVRVVGGAYALTISTNNFTQVTSYSAGGSSVSADVVYTYNDQDYPELMTYVGQAAYKMEYLCEGCLPLPSIADAGPDQIGVPDTMTTLEGNTPVEGIGTWTITHGDSGIIIDKHDPETIFQGKDSIYYLKWAIKNECGETSDEVLITFGKNWTPCPGLPVVNYGGQTYNTVQIGNQCWMKENLNIGIRIDGDQEQTNNQTIEKYCSNDNENNCDEYGGLYQWEEMMQYATAQGSKGICPEGWHLPSDDEWSTLIDYLGGDDVAGGKMKETGTTHWNLPNTGASNESGFTALPGGIRTSDGSFIYLAEYAGFWSSTEDNISEAWRRYLGYDYSGVYHESSSKDHGRSVRCVCD